MPARGLRRAASHATAGAESAVDSDRSLLRVSVVVPTYRRPELLERCVTALLQQRLPSAEYEILVVDDAGDADTAACVGRLAAAAMVTIQYLTVAGRHGPAAARNVGWRAARAPIIALTDDDCIPSPEWLSEGLAAFTDGVSGVQGAILMPLPAVPTDYERSAVGLTRAEFPTANCFYRREALAQSHGFDERFTRAWREDGDLYFTLLERGHRLIRIEGARVVHPVRPASWGISLRQARNNLFEPLLRRKHPRLYRERVRTAVARYTVMTLCLCGALVAVGLGHVRWAMTLGGLWALFTVRFCRRRLRGTSPALSHVAEMAITSALLPPVSLAWRVAGACRFVWFSHIMPFPDAIHKENR